MKSTAAVLAFFIAACAGEGNGQQDTSTDQLADSADPATDAADDSLPDDAGGEAGCSSDSDCDDTDSCTTDTCDLDYNECLHEAVDVDGDGYPAAEVGGTECTGGLDCDDYDDAVHPGAAPDCTGTTDMDCDGFDDPDEDGDGHDSLACAGDDCDDSDPGAFPGSLELDCSSEDRDCNGSMDSDNDGDGDARLGCAGGGDCDDADPEVGSLEDEADCDGIDTDCDGEMSVYEDADRDGYSRAECVAAGGEVDCDDGESAIHPAAPEDCDAVDDDCDGEWADAPGADDDLDGWLDPACGGADCDDEDSTNHPGADADGDGHEDFRCGGDDCDDGDPETYPGAPELCPDATDQDCDTMPDCHGHETCGSSGTCEIAWVTIPAGIFSMGSPDTDPGRFPSETQHSVTLTHSFEILAAELTQHQFQEVMGYGPSSFSACGGHCPVEQVNWHEAAAYTNALSSASGYALCYSCTGSGVSVTCEPSADFPTPYDCPGYRLPTDAEWEYAARAGTLEATYNGTSVLLDCAMPNEVLDPIAWFCGNAGATTHAAGSRAANPWDLYDMLGNVWEWCSDWYVSDLGTAAVTDPWGPSTGTERVVRGGAWSLYARNSRAASRALRTSGYRNDSTGFRPARTFLKETCSLLDNDRNGYPDIDNDNDGHADMACPGGEDCNDSDAGEWSGAWYDPATGYLWENPPTGGNLGWGAAVAYCNGLSLCGHGAGGWQLPSMDELRTSILGCPETGTGGACGVTYACLDDPCWTDCEGCASMAGPGTGGCYMDAALEGGCSTYWSSSSHGADPSRAWSAGFDDASIGNDDKGSTSMVRCVRTGTDGPSCEIGGWSLRQANSIQSFTFPPGTSIPDGGYLVLARNIDQPTFESFWGVTLGSNIVFVNGGTTVPQINGDETYTLIDDLGAVVDGPTVAMPPNPAGETVRRIDGSLPSDAESAWSRAPCNIAGNASPGASALPRASWGVLISEFSDALGTGAYVFEFVELYCDN